METERAILTEGLTKSFGRVKAVQELDLSVERGKIYGLIGPNGSGKTTTMRLLCGLLRPDSGEAYVLGQQVPDFHVLHRIGYMPQENAVYIMLRGWGVSGIAFELGILALFAVLMLALSIALMRRRAYTS